MCMSAYVCVRISVSVCLCIERECVCVQCKCVCVYVWAYKRKCVVCLCVERVSVCVLRVCAYVRMSYVFEFLFVFAYMRQCLRMWVLVCERVWELQSSSVLILCIIRWNETFTPFWRYFDLKVLWAVRTNSTVIWNFSRKAKFSFQILKPFFWRKVLMQDSDN